MLKMVNLYIFVIYYIVFMLKINLLLITTFKKYKVLSFVKKIELMYLP